MATKQRTTMEIGHRVRERLLELLRSTDVRHPIPGLILAEVVGDGPERYLFGIYDREEIAEQPFVIVEPDGIELLIIQREVLSVLEGKRLDIKDGELSLLERSKG